MHITILGYIFIPLGMVLFFFLKSDYLLFLTVMFSGFTASSVINVEYISFGLAPSYYFGMLFIIKYIFIVLKNKNLVKPNFYLALFIIISFISMMLSKFLNNEGILVYGIGNGLRLKVVEFSMQNITQYMYLIFAFIIYWLIKDRLKDDISFINKIIKVYLFSGFIISLIGFYQVVAYYYNLSFDIIFRSNPLGWQQGIRIYAVAAEPSMMAYFIVPTLSLAFSYKKKVGGLNSYIIFILLFILGVLTTSTTFLIGIIGFAVVYFFRNIINYRTIIKYLTFVGVLVFIVIVIFNFNEEIRIRLWDKSIAKLQLNNASGVSRYEVFSQMISVGFMYPFFGVGFGSGRSTDLYSHLFATTGIIGSATFFIYIFYSFYKMLKYSRKNYLKEISDGYVYFLFTFLICSISVPEFMFLFFWVNFGVIDSIILSYKSFETCNKRNIDKNLQKKCYKNIRDIKIERRWKVIVFLYMFYSISCIIKFM
ncbi:oligosaccharide repeat unit polymerase [Clostridium sp. SYSU_GA19001]|uniref:O-antigen polymerase n=1 Tax=Clostridium caldaquaticum TaxID=2940653 RepID=UPI0020772A01|nr:O-antigen polymerase [Clostridium caldaquaticum]MCM8711376.1 oligosaccharide repeat unit polymerase [Clostridium caldaquaticum]